MIRTGVCKTLGGKSLSCRMIAAVADSIPHRIYVEPFCGAASVYLAKRPAGDNILNDLNRDLVTLLRVAAWHPEALCAELAHYHLGRLEHARLKDLAVEHLTDIQRAARHWFLSYAGYLGGKGGESHFSASKRAVWTTTLKVYGAWLADIAIRLRQAIIECLPWQEAIRRYDKPRTLFYCDPPYLGVTGYQGVPFAESEHRELAAALHAIKGQFLLSVGLHPLVRELYPDCRIRRLRVQRPALTRSAGHPFVTELLIFGPPGRLDATQGGLSEPTGRTTRRPLKRPPNPAQSPSKPGIAAPR